MIKSIYHIFLSLIMTGLVVSCVKHEFDKPPVSTEDPNLTANTTIAELKALHSAGKFDVITDDRIIVGIVIADDESGNYYKTIVIQDHTGGIELKINATDQYVKYPVGRRLFIKCKGLTLGDYNGVVQLGGGVFDNNGSPSLGGIEQALTDTYIFPGQYKQYVTPKKLKITELTQADVSTLVELEDVEFASGESGKTYADVVGKTTQNRTVEDCNKNVVIMRTSGYANFAGDLLPTGKGTLTAVYSIFGSTKQVYIRDTRDVVFTGTRCGGGSGTVTPNTTIAQLKALHTSAFNVINGDVIIEGVVTADDQSGNFYKEINIQDATGGLGVKINVTNIYQSYPVGTKIAINCKGLTLGTDGDTKLGGNTYQSNGKDLLGGLDAAQMASNIVINGTGTPTPKPVTINSLGEADFSNFVILNDVQFVSGDVGQPYADAAGKMTLNRIVEDCDGNTITVRTSGYADFASSLAPGGKGTLVGIYENFGNTKQLFIRSAADASMSGSRCSTTPTPGLEELDEDFESQQNEVDISLQGWTNIAVAGTRIWRGKIYQGNAYAQATAFKSSDATNTTWLVTPGMDLSTPKTLSFESAKQVWVHDGLSVWISYDFNGGNAASATWTEISCTLAGKNDPDNTFIQSGIIDLPVNTSKAYIGFKYTGDKTTNTTSYRIDNVKIKKK